MAKVVINKCYGGFSLSDAGVKRYAEIKGLTLYPEQNRFSMTDYWTVPPDKREGKILDESEWWSATDEQRRASNEFHRASIIYSRDIPRDDQVLIQVVEEMGSAANGKCADLQVIEIPDGVDWQVEEYDGREWIAENHRTWP